MKLHELYPFPSEQKSRKRRGRGPGGGLGCTSGKGNKGQKARAGGGPAVGFEGGQMPLVRRLPKRGFKNLFQVRYAVVNLEQLESHFSGKDTISLEDLYTLCPRNLPIKVLGRGEITRSITVEAHRFSKSAAQKIQSAGGQAKALEG
jgi:large subunit ribosomal protein L15